MSIKYYIYARKSSDSEDRQVQSIGDQVNDLTTLANNLSINVVDVLTESKSAKDPYIRPVFSKMLQDIQDGKADGVLCWQLNRLSRNAVDSGVLQHLLQKGTIKSIKTIDREYLPTDNTLIFSVESGVSNQFILDLRKGTIRGLNSKVKKGDFPGLARIGYLNSKNLEQGKNKIIVDPERFDLVRKAWDLLLTGNYTVAQIVEETKRWGLKTRQTKKRPSRYLSTSTAYDIFTNVFYTGWFKYKGKLEPGNHKEMISMNEYDLAQKILGSRGNPRPKSQLNFDYRGVLTCAECGCAYTPMKKKKKIKSTGETKFYTYYYCTNRKRDYSCSQRKGLREEEVNRQINQELDTLTILPEFKDWALEILERENNKETDTRSKIYENLQKEHTSLQKQLDNLVKLRIKELIDDSEYRSQRNDLKLQIRKVGKNLNNTEKGAENWLELTEKTFDFVTYARYHFNNGTPEQKRNILAGIGQNPTVLNGKIFIPTNKWLIPIKNRYKKLEEVYLGLELSKKVSNKAKEEDILSLKSEWGG